MSLNAGEVAARLGVKVLRTVRGGARTGGDQVDRWMDAQRDAIAILCEIGRAHV